MLTSTSATHVRGLLDLQHARIRAALDTPHVDPAMLDDLATYIVAVNQALAVLSRAGASDAELRAVVRLACETVANRLTPAH